MLYDNVLTHLLLPTPLLQQYGGLITEIKIKNIMNNNIDDYIYERFLPTLLWLRDYMGFNHASESQGEGNGDNMNNTERETSTTPNESL